MDRISRTHRMTAIAAAPLVAMAMAIAGCGADDQATAPRAPLTTSAGMDATGSIAPAAVEYAITVAHGAKMDGPSTISTTTHDTIVLLVTSDSADEVHVHGYDVEAELEPGKPVRLELHGAPAGAYEVELHNSGVKLATIEVQS